MTPSQMAEFMRELVDGYVPDCREKIIDLIVSHEQLKQRFDEAKKVLEFYTNAENFVYLETNIGDVYLIEVDDRTTFKSDIPSDYKQKMLGKRAKEFLASLGVKGEK